MKKPLLALMVLVATCFSSARGQSADTSPAAPLPAPEEIRAPDGIPPALQLEKRKLVAEDAEAAEELEMRRPRPRWWGRTEFLLWFIKPAHLPSLVTTGSFTEPRPGALDSPDTQVLFGREGMDYQDRTGGRFTLGKWLDDDQTWSASAGYFFVRGRSIGQAFSSPGAPVLALPFFNTQTGNQDSSLITFPGIASGSVVVDAPSFLQGAEGNLNAALLVTEHVRWEASCGFRYLNLQESLNIHGVTLVQIAPQYQGFGLPFDGNTMTVHDEFQTCNQFYGGQIGTRLELTHGRWGLEMLGKVALGMSRQVITLRGATTIDTQPTFAQDSGLYVVSSNSGRHTHHAFAVAPEVGATLKFRLTDRLTLFGGYSFLYWNNVARPGDQVDQAVNPNLVPTSATFGAAGGDTRPGLLFRSTDFYAHGANFGLEFCY